MYNVKPLVRSRKMQMKPLVTTELWCQRFWCKEICWVKSNSLQVAKWFLACTGNSHVRLNLSTRGKGHFFYEIFSSLKKLSFIISFFRWNFSSCKKAPPYCLEERGDRQQEVLLYFKKRTVHWQTLTREIVYFSPYTILTCEFYRLRVVFKFPWNKLICGFSLDVILKD